MKRRTNTLDAEYKRRGLIRPNQVAKSLGLTNIMFVGINDANDLVATVEAFAWKGNPVWGVRPGVVDE